MEKLLSDESIVSSNLIEGGFRILFVESTNGKAC